MQDARATWRSAVRVVKQRRCVVPMFRIGLRVSSLAMTSANWETRSLEGTSSCLDLSLLHAVMDSSEVSSPQYRVLSSLQSFDASRIVAPLFNAIVLEDSLAKSKIPRGDHYFLLFLPIFYEHPNRCRGCLGIAVCDPQHLLSLVFLVLSSNVVQLTMNFGRPVDNSAWTRGHPSLDGK